MSTATVPLLFLLKSHLTLSIPDFYYLMAESLDYQEPFPNPQLLCGLSEGMMAVGLERTPLNFPKKTCASITITIQTAFGIPLPQLLYCQRLFQTQARKFSISQASCLSIKISYNYMDIHQPHGSPLKAKFSCAVWGGWKEQNTT